MTLKKGTTTSKTDANEKRGKVKQTTLKRGTMTSKTDANERKRQK